MSWEPLIRFPPAWTSVLGNFGVHLFEGHLSLAQMDHMQLLAERWLEQRRSSLARPGARFDGQLVELVVIHPSDARMTHEERTRMARLIKSGESRRAASATVILAQGIVASVQRSVLTGLTMLVPPPHPAKVFGEIDDALSWLYPHIQASLGSRAVSPASTPGPSLTLEELRKELRTHLEEFRKRPDRPTF